MAASFPVIVYQPREEPRRPRAFSGKISGIIRERDGGRACGERGNIHASETHLFGSKKGLSTAFFFGNPELSPQIRGLFRFFPKVIHLVIHRFCGFKPVPDVVL
jgi:hypothetical protein